MTPHQIEIVRQSFAKIMPYKDQVIELFYCRLFELDPSIRLMFKSDMAEQREKLTAALAMVISRLEMMEGLLPVLRELGRRHKTYGVRNRHYDVVGAALLWTLEIGLSSSWTKELAEAWRDASGQVANAMIEGAESPEPERRPTRRAAE
jgi:hemoglobin-like flavoprotein